MVSPINSTQVALAKIVTIVFIRETSRAKAYKIQQLAVSAMITALVSVSMGQSAPTDMCDARLSSSNKCHAFQTGTSKR